MAGEHAVEPFAGFLRRDHNRFLRYTACHGPNI
jgi:hypothetical protein